MLTLDCERLLRRTVVRAVVQSMCQYLPGTAVTPITSSMSPPTPPPCTCLQSILASVPNSERADLFSIFIACLFFKFPVNNVKRPLCAHSFFILLSAQCFWVQAHCCTSGWSALCVSERCVILSPDDRHLELSQP